MEILSGHIYLGSYKPPVHRCVHIFPKIRKVFCYYVIDRFSMASTFSPYIRYSKNMDVCLLMVSQRSQMHSSLFLIFLFLIFLSFFLITGIFQRISLQVQIIFFCLIYYVDESFSCTFYVTY